MKQIHPYAVGEALGGRIPNNHFFRTWAKEDAGWQASITLDIVTHDNAWHALVDYGCHVSIHPNGHAAWARGSHACKITTIMQCATACRASC